MRTKICLAATTDLVYDQRMMRICDALDQAGYQVTLIGRKKPNSPSLDQKPYHQHRLKCKKQSGKLFYLEYNIRLFFYLLFHRAGIICAVDLDTILACTAAGKLKMSKRVFDAHEYFTELPEVIHRPWIQKTWRWVEKLTVPQMHLCYTVSDSLAGIFEQIHQQKFHVIKNVPYLKKHQSEKSEVPFILYQGALNEGRGLELLIKAMKHIDAKLLIAGSGDLDEPLKLLTSYLELQKKVRFLGYVKPQALQSLTEEAFLGYNLLEDKSLSYYYSLSNKFFDYMHAGVPSLSNPFPEYEKINKEYEVSKLIHLEEQALIATINQLLEDRNYYNELVANCYKARAIWNWQKESRKLINLYNEGLR